MIYPEIFELNAFLLLLSTMTVKNIRYGEFWNYIIIIIMERYLYHAKNNKKHFACAMKLWN